jgi:hypothetical protein
VHGPLVIVELEVGAVILAIWVDARLGARRPGAIRTRLAHTACAFVLLQLGSVAIAHLIHDSTPRATITGLLCLVFLPTLVYALLTGLWMLRTLTDALR